MHKSQAIVLSVAFGCLAFSSAAMIQTPPNSSPSPQRPTPQRPMNSNNADATNAVLKSIEGSWTISMRMLSDASANAPSAADRMMTGTSSRAWILGDSVLQEEVEIKGGTDQGRDSNRPRNSGGPNAQQDPKDQISDGFEGLGLFSIDGDTNGISHVWADSKSDGMIFCMGTYDPSTKTITFASHEGSLSHDGDRSGHAYGDDNRSTNSNDRRDAKDSTGHSAPTGNPSTSNDPPSARGVNTPPSGTKDVQRDDNRRASRDGSGQPLVTLRIINENEHVVTMTQPGSKGQAKTYEITYRRAGGDIAVNNPGGVR